MISRPMPLAGAYAAAVQNPFYCFTDPVLRGAVIEKNVIGQPRAMSGQFSVVFPMTSPDGKRHAVKCFTHDAPNHLHRYELINNGLAALRPRWATDFVFQPHGIKVEGESYPILRMDWVAGATLMTWLDSHRGAAAEIGRLADGFDQLMRELSDAGIAHGDLQHGNILVQPDGGLRLIDYDGIYLPGIGLEQYPSHETGLPGYQHPSRTAAGYGPDMDRFSARLIALSLQALAADPGLLDALNPGRGEYLLLDQEDFADPWSSPRMARLEAHHTPPARDLASAVRTMLALPPEEIPPLGMPLPTGPVTAPSRHAGPAGARRVVSRRGLQPPSRTGGPSWLAGARPAPVRPVSAARHAPRPVSVATWPTATKPAVSRHAGVVTVAAILIFLVLVTVISYATYGGKSGPLPVGTDFLLSNGQILDAEAGGAFALVGKSGTLLWSTGSTGITLATDTAPYSVPQLSGNCVTEFQNNGDGLVERAGGEDYYTISGGGYATVSGNRAAWGDGTIGNACTGDVLVSGDGPAGITTYPECLAGSVVVQITGTWASPDGMQAWGNDQQLWVRDGPFNAVCDGSGTTALLSKADNTVNLINPATGDAYWHASAPACVSPGSRECVTNSKYPVRMFETPGIVILSAPGVVLAFDKKTGKPLWRKAGECALAARTSPEPQALLGPCTYLASTDNGRAIVVDPADGTVAKTLNVGIYDQWTANATTLLAVHTGTGTFREMKW